MKVSDDSKEQTTEDNEVDDTSKVSDNPDDQTKETGGLLGGSNDSMKVSDDSKEQTSEDDEVNDTDIDKIFSEMLIPPPVSAILMTPRITEDANNFSEQLVGFQTSQKLHSDDSKEQSNENVEKVHEANETDKGQLISKGLFGVFNSPKKRTKNVCPSRLGQKFEF
jgi:hypothetical protein